ncbi:hypothetical protein U1Q18_017231, partial [Sarracenia purpurea var. burkii]
ESLSVATCCRSLVIVYDNQFILQTGFAAATSTNDWKTVPVDVHNLMRASLYQSVSKSGSQSYWENLSLYPGKSELPFLPSNTQAIILQPLGDKGIAIIGGDTIRGFTTSDQVRIPLIGEKSDATLTKCVNEHCVSGIVTQVAVGSYIPPPIGLHVSPTGIPNINLDRKLTTLTNESSSPQLQALCKDIFSIYSKMDLHPKFEQQTENAEHAYTRTGSLGSKVQLSSEIKIWNRLRFEYRTMLSLSSMCRQPRE